MVSRIRPRPSASARSPLEVSSAIAVVITRVTWLMLPPTMITAPTSAEARPKPARNAVARLKRPSQIKVGTARSGPTPSARSCSSYSWRRSSMVWRLSAAMIGVISTVWAMIMAAGEYSRPKPPMGPALDSIR